MKDIMVIIGFVIWFLGFLFAIYCFYSALCSD